jgi:uncharacterized repeat protein (TIGR01451 family)
MRIIKLITLVCCISVSFSVQGGTWCKTVNPTLVIWGELHYDHKPKDCPDEYAAELINWKPYTMENEISPDVAKELLKLPADGGLSDLEEEYPSLNNRLREFYGDENPPLVQDIMRDLIFLESIQDDIQTWEEKSEKGGSFSEVYTTAQSIATDYQEYLTERKVSSVFGAVILSTLEGTINGEIEGKIKEIAKDQFLHTGYKVEPTKLIKGLATSFVKDVVKIGAKKLVGEKNAVFVDILTGNWIEGIIYMAKEPDNIYGGKLLLQYYYLMKKYGTQIMDDCSFAELEGDRGQQIKVSSEPYPCKTIEKDDERGQYLYNVDAAPTLNYSGKHADILGIAPSIHEMASLFLVIDNLDIEQLQKNLVAFAYAKYLAGKEPAIIEQPYEELNEIDSSEGEEPVIDEPDEELNEIDSSEGEEPVIDEPDEELNEIDSSEGEEPVIDEPDEELNEIDSSEGIDGAECQSYKRAFVMVVDSSGSNTTTDPSNLRIAAAKQTVERLNSIEDVKDMSCSQADVAAAIDFDSSTRILSELADPNEVIPVFDEIDSSGGTNIAAGINTATTMLANYNDEVSSLDNKMALAVLTDGENNSGPIPVIKAIMNARLKGIRVHYGHLQPLSTTRSRKNIPEEEDSVVSHRTRQGQESDNEVLPATIEEAVLATGGVYAIIRNASAQLAFVEQIESQGFTNSDPVNPKGLLLGSEIETWGIISSPEQSRAFFLKGRQNTKTQILVNTYEHFIPLVTVRNSNGQIVAKYDGSPTEDEDSVIQLALEFHRADEYTVEVSSYDGNIGTFSILLEAETEISLSCATEFSELDGEQLPICRNTSGTIFDKLGYPIAGVTIEVDGKTTLTDETGYWEITGLPEGEYTVIASKEGYLSESKPCVVSVNENICQPKLRLEPVLDVKVVPEPRIAKQGEDVTYTITVTNQGEGTATNVTLADVLPDNTKLVSIEALDGGSCEAETVTCSLPDLTSGATANVKVVVSNRQTETLINTVTVTTQEYPTDVKKTWTQVIPYLSVTVSDLPDPIEMLNVLHYSVVVELSHYAPTDATSITLVSQLPSGVELQSITSDYGVCDTGALPQITCQMTDLSIASAESISHATIEMDVELKDAGLLLLTHEAKVTANEYPAHSDRERTTIFIPEGIQVDLAFVIDVTGSMQGEMNGVIKALTDFTNEIDPSTAPLMALLTFSDEVKVAAFTRDTEVLKGALADLTASGGGLCEEAAVEALLVAVPHTIIGGDILFATDASPYADADVEKVIELLRSKGIRFNAMITGDCSMPESWNQLP